MPGVVSEGMVDALVDEVAQESWYDMTRLDKSLPPAATGAAMPPAHCKFLDADRNTAREKGARLPQETTRRRR